MASISSSASSSMGSVPAPLRASIKGVSYPKPTGKVYVELNADKNPTYTAKSSMEELMQLMRTSGKALVARAALASSYLEEPKRCSRFKKQDVYGWGLNAKRNENAQVTYSLILAAKQQAARGNFVYFVECHFVRLHEGMILTVELEPQRPTQGYYVVTHKIFNKYLKRILVPVKGFHPSNEDKSVTILTMLTSSLSQMMPELSASQNAYVEKLHAFGPTSAILEDEGAMAKCKALGQEIFDKYKAEEGSSLKGFYAAQRICNALAFNRAGFKTRERLDFKEAVARAWEGIGDSTKRWIA